MAKKNVFKQGCVAKVTPSAFSGQNNYSLTLNLTEGQYSVLVNALLDKTAEGSAIASDLRAFIENAVYCAVNNLKL